LEIQDGETPMTEATGIWKLREIQEEDRDAKRGVNLTAWSRFILPQLD